MTPQQAREQIGFALKRAAPGSDVDSIDPDDDLRDALELDSLDFLQFIEILSETSGHRIEEDDYPELATLNSSIRFLAARLPRRADMASEGRERECRSCGYETSLAASGQLALPAPAMRPCPRTGAGSWSRKPDRC